MTDRQRCKAVCTCVSVFACQSLQSKTLITFPRYHIKFLSCILSELLLNYMPRLPL